MQPKTAEITRKTRETDITAKITLYPEELSVAADTGIGFFDHMLTALFTHSGISLYIKCEGDLNVDCHHTAEDCGIVLGKALAELTSDKTGIARYGEAHIPMDEALGFAAVDISGRPYLVFDADFISDRLGTLDTQMIEEFFYAFSHNAGITLHVRLVYGKNDHHKAEALFKATAHSLKKALIPTGLNKPLSTKGVL